MRSSSLLLSAVMLASTGTAAVAGLVSKQDCLLQNSEDLASFSNCGRHDSLNECFSSLASFDFRDIQTCYINAGCSPREAKTETEFTLTRCRDLTSRHNAGTELRRRFRAALEPRVAPATQAPRQPAQQSDLAAVDSGFFLFPRTGLTGAENCYSTSTVSTTQCSLTTSDSVPSTLSCFPTEVAQSQCIPGYTCSLAANGDDVCMALEHINTGGIVVAIVFAVIITICIGTLTFLCVKDKREQKRLAAKAEATALARAATKKKKADEARAQRAPLIQKHQGESQDVTANPFDDGTRL